LKHYQDGSDAKFLLCTAVLSYEHFIHNWGW